jgi:osmotically-inducible protein OsmY
MTNLGMRRVLIATALVALLSPVSSFAQDSPGLAVRLGDARIAASIETMFLLSDQLNPFNISTKVESGMVTLSGGVADAAQKDLAADLAHSVGGVRAVDNQIIVVEAPPEKQGGRGFRQVFEDRTLSATIRSRLLWHKQFHGLKVDIRVEEGVCTLAGVVNSEEQKQAIGRIAGETRGVVRVVNLMAVEERVPLDPVAGMGRQVTDKWLKTRIETAILFNRNVSIFDLDVAVVDRKAVLTGVVPVESQKALAGALAASVYGVEDVRNEIQVKALELAPMDPEPL